MQESAGTSSVASTMPSAYRTAQSANDGSDSALAGSGKQDFFIHALPMYDINRAIARSTLAQIRIDLDLDVPMQLHRCLLSLREPLISSSLHKEL